jgi:hypothetical protein
MAAEEYQQGMVSAPRSYLPLGNLQEHVAVTSYLLLWRQGPTKIYPRRLDWEAHKPPA